MRSSTATGVMLAATAGVAVLVGPGLGVMLFAGAVGAGTFASVKRSLNRMTEAVADCQLAAAGDRQKHRRRIIKDARAELDGNHEIAKWCGLAGFACPPLGLAVAGTLAATAAAKRKKAEATDK